MGCGTSKDIPKRSKSARRASQVTMESQQRTVAAYRRQRIARDLEQDTYLRAEAEVEKALMLKRSSVDERRPSYILRVLEDLEEIEEGQEEKEDKHPVITIDSSSEMDIKRKENTESEYFTHKNEHRTNESEDDTNERREIKGDESEDTITHEYHSNVRDDGTIITEHNTNESEHGTITPEHQTKEQYKNESESLTEKSENCANNTELKANSGGFLDSNGADHVIDRLQDGGKNENKINENLELNTTDVSHDNSLLSKDAQQDNTNSQHDIESNDNDG